MKGSGCLLKGIQKLIYIERGMNNEEMEEDIELQ